MSMSPVGLGTKNYCAGEGQHQLSRESVTIIFVQDGMCPGQDSKSALPAYESEDLPEVCKPRRTFSSFESNLNVVCAHGSDM
jgi:hypothetical protein